MEEGEIPQLSKLQELKTSHEVVSLSTQIEIENAGIPSNSFNLPPICKLKGRLNDKELFMELLAGKSHGFQEGKISFDNCCLFKKLPKLN
jgi:hypothetical protein